jgi:CheY-like chemotaxis protein
MFLREERADGQIPAEESMDRADPSSAQATVLIVDDDVYVREALCEVVSEEGLDVAMASNGREALDLLTAGLRPIVIFLDVMMPVMDGVTFRSAQLAMAEARTIPVAVMTASGKSREAIAAAFGDVEYLPKPMDLDAILAVLERRRAPV